MIKPISASGEKISFPRQWEYRLFFEAGKIAGADEAVRQAAERIGVPVQVTRGKSSSGGSYCALHVAGMVNSMEMAEILGKALAAIPGVKFLL